MNLPKSLEYILPAARICEAEELQWNWNVAMTPFIAGLNQSEIRTLSRVYEAIERREDSERISEWYDDQPPIEHEEGFAGPVFRMLCVFEELADRDLSPFSSRRVAYRHFEKPRDWSKIPQHLCYLIEPAERFGHIQFDGDVIEFLENISHEDCQQLQVLANTIEAKNHREPIHEWLEEFLITEHPEAARVYFTLGLLVMGDFFQEGTDEVE